MGKVSSRRGEGSGRVKIRIGVGFDIHRLEPNRTLTLGGVRIPHPKGLIGHSDGDVLLHAIADALLGAAAMGDIGEKFPDTDERYRDMDSRVMLASVADEIRSQGYSIGNIDSNVLAEQPKLLSHFPRMKEAIAAVVGIPTVDVHVKAKTMEKIGAIGAEEAIAAHAVALVFRD